MGNAAEITAGVFRVGGDGLSHADDCCVYLIDGGSESALIDTGAGKNISLLQVTCASTDRRDNKV